MINTQSYNNFWQNIHSSSKNKAFPLRVMFELTYRCNFKCLHCYVPFKYRKYKELKTKEVFGILDQLKDIGCFYLGFTGGEPFMRKDILDILWYAKKKGFEVIIYTNGSLITAKTAKELTKLMPNKIDITIPAMTKNAFEKITCAPGSRDKVFKAIELLHKNNVNLGFKTCVLKANQNEISQIQGFAKKLNALHRLDNMLSHRLNGSREPFKYKGPLARCPLPVSSLSVKQNKPKRLDEDINLFKCGVGISQAAITPQGELKMCLMIEKPKYKINVTLKTAWEKMKGFVSSIKPDKNYKCHVCQLQPYCKWCPAHSWLEHGNFTSCETRVREKAEAIKHSFLYDTK